MSEKCVVCGRETWRAITAIEGRLSPHNACHRDDSKGVTFNNLECYRLGYDRLAREIAAAEERGRRRGVEEARSLVGFVRHLQALVADGYTEGALNAIRALREKDFPALAPRDSGKEPAKMDTPHGPTCWCGRFSKHESGWCGEYNCERSQ